MGVHLRTESDFASIVTSACTLGVQVYIECTVIKMAPSIQCKESLVLLADCTNASVAMGPQRAMLSWKTTQELWSGILDALL